MLQNVIITHLVEQLLLVQNGKPWIGETFEKKINSITEEEAFIRPYPTLHCPAELIAHLTAWRVDAIKKIVNGNGQLLDAQQENWPKMADLQRLGWIQLLKEYDDSLQTIINLLSERNDDFLYQQYYDQDFKGQFSYSFAINGILQHDVYHLGQLGMVIKLIKERRSG
jgi:hypothetical protein